MKKIGIFILFIALLGACSDADIKKNCCQEIPLIFNENNVLLGMPNFFSPNNDSSNDTYGPLGGGILSYTMQIIDTEDTVFTGVGTINDNLLAGYWDGRVNGAVQDGIFGYALTIRTVNEDTIAFNGIFCSLPDPETVCIDDPDQCVTQAMFTNNGWDFDLPTDEVFCE